MENAPVKPQPGAVEPQNGQNQEAPKPKASSQINDLLKRHDAYVKKEMALKAQQAKLEEERKAFLAEKAKEDQWRQTWKENPLKAIQERGLTPEELWLAQQKGQMTPELQMKLLMEELNSVKAKLGEYDQQGAKSKEEAAKAELESADAALREQIGEALGLDDYKTKYPFTSGQNAVNIVMKAIDKLEAKLPADTPEEKILEMALTETEKYLSKRAKEQAELYQKTVQAQAPQPTPQTQQKRPYFGDSPEFTERLQVEKPTKTLAQVQQTVTPQVSRFKTEEEREANALALLRAARQRRGIS